MKHKVEKIFFALLRFEIAGVKLSDDVKNLITDDLLPSLFKLSKIHDLAHLIGDALDKNGLLIGGAVVLGLLIVGLIKKNKKEEVEQDEEVEQEEVSYEEDEEETYSPGVYPVTNYQIDDDLNNIQLYQDLAIKEE